MVSSLGTKRVHLFYLSSVTEKELSPMTKKFCGALSAALAIVLTLSACGKTAQPASSNQSTGSSVSSSIDFFIF